MDRATVYIPTLNGGDALRECLLSLRAQTLPVEVVVADNSSGPACQQLLESEFPEVTRVAMGGNRGFGPALNRAIAERGSGPIILVNDDAVADPGFASAMIAAASSGAEMVAAVLVSGTDESMIDSAGIEVDETAMGYDYLSGEPIKAAANAAAPIAPTGGGALYSREAFGRVGGFDERIFLYYEDLDLGLRIRASGGTCVLAPEARLRHAYSQTLGALSAAKFRHTGWSRGYMMRTYGVGRKPALMARALLVEALVCLGQIATRRTFQGALGRIRGWRAAGSNERRELDSAWITDLSLREALGRRSKR